MRVDVKLCIEEANRTEKDGRLQPWVMTGKVSMTREEGEKVGTEYLAIIFS